MSQSKDCPIVWGTRASPIGRSVDGAAARVHEHATASYGLRRRGETYAQAHDLSEGFLERRATHP